MGGCGWMDDERFHICHISQEGEKLQLVDKLCGFLLSSLNLKGKDGTSSFGEILFIKGMVRAAGEEKDDSLFSTLG
jgi:hypothetical protein